MKLYKTIVCSLALTIAILPSLASAATTGNQVLSKRSVEMALAPHGYLDGEAVYGYGWFVEGTPGIDGMPLTFRHGGHDGTVAIAFPLHAGHC